MNDNGTKVWNHECGGVVYNNSTVITAGHCCCCRDMSFIEVAAGGVDFENLDDKTGSWQRSKIKEYIIHPLYMPASKKNDICKLILEQQFTFNENIEAIQLDVDNLDTEVDCSISGWGNINVNTLLIRYVNT